MSAQYLPRLINLPEGQTIPMVGESGRVAWLAIMEDVPLTAAYLEAAESIPSNKDGQL